MGIEDDQLLAIQNDLCERLKARDEARERAISKKLHKLEQKHEFANAQLYIQQISIQIVAKNNVRILPGCTGIVSAALKTSRSTLTPRNTIMEKA